MAEKLTLSKIETFALIKAREQLAQAQDAFKEIISAVATAHGLEEKDRMNWQFTPNFSELVFKPAPEPPKE